MTTTKSENLAVFLNFFMNAPVLQEAHFLSNPVQCTQLVPTKKAHITIMICVTLGSKNSFQKNFLLRWSMLVYAAT